MLLFGTSGLRGLVRDMTDKECFVNAKGFLDYLLGERQIAPDSTVSLAGDLRSSTDRILRAVAQAVLSTGCRVENCGKIPSPALLHHAMRLGQASIMVTGSHIPDDRNGIKFNQPLGEILKSDEPGILTAVRRIREQEENRAASESLFQPDESLKPELPNPLPAPGPEAGQEYLERYRGLFPENALAGKRIVVDQHSAVGRDLLVQILQALGAVVVAVGRTDRFVAKDTENVTPEMADDFRALARQHQPFAIVSTDGDSDRPFVVDETGCFHRGDVLGAVVAAFLKAGSAAVPVSANDAVNSFLAQKGIRLRQTRIGSPYVVAAMQAAAREGLGPAVGWEANGGFMTASDFIFSQKRLAALPSRDAVLPILCSLMAAAEAGSVSRVFKALPQRFTQSGLIDGFPPESSRRLLQGFQPEVQAVRAEFDKGSAVVFYQDGSSKTHPAGGMDPVLDGFWNEAPSYAGLKAALEYYFRPDQGFARLQAVEWLDGVRIFFSNRDVAHIRPSGNAPQLRMYSNADRQERADEIVRLGIAANGLLRSMETDIAHGRISSSEQPHQPLE